MSLPIMLDPPEIITQTAQTCWAAAFESWSLANARLSGAHHTVGRQQLIRWLEDGGLTYPSGRATPEGMTVMAGLGLMRMIPASATAATIENLGTILEHGYLYLVYFRRAGTPAHAVVCYGVDAENIYLMDPWPGRGLITRESSFFLHMQAGSVIFGLPMAVALARSVERSLEGLRVR